MKRSLLFIALSFVLSAIANAGPAFDAGYRAGFKTGYQQNRWRIRARTGLTPSQASEVILLPSGANSSFLVVSRIGPFSAWQRLNGTVFSAGAGSFNLATGVFTRTGSAMNQLVIYGIDSAIVASLRVPADVNTAVDPSR